MAGDLMILFAAVAIICTALVGVEALVKVTGFDKRWVDDEPVPYSPVDHDPTGGAA